MKVYELQKKLGGEFKTVGYFCERAKAEEAQKSPGLGTRWRIVEHDAEPRGTRGQMAVISHLVQLS